MHPRCRTFSAFVAPEASYHHRGAPDSIDNFFQRSRGRVLTPDPDGRPISARQADHRRTAAHEKDFFFIRVGSD
jgi:hypothetical protein